VVVDDELTDDAIAGTYRVFQRRRGHRYSLDDVVTAWEAARAQPTATRCLDLGTGIGSVLIMLAYRFPNAEIRTTLRRGDLRDRGTLEDLPGGPFDLVTGTPPYMDPKDGTLPPDSQKAHARMELRGGVEDYLRAAALVVAPKGRVVMCAGAREPERAIEGGRAAGLLPIRRRDVIPRANEKGPLFFVLTFARAEDHDGSFEHSPPLVARDEGGARTSGAHELRRFFGLEPNEAEPPSP
jgi:tRNA1(Val) A37 N6-methylase TrmN6